MLQGLIPSQQDVHTREIHQVPGKRVASSGADEDSIASLMGHGQKRKRAAGRAPATL